MCREVTQLQVSSDLAGGADSIIDVDNALRGGYERGE